MISNFPLWTFPLCVARASNTCIYIYQLIRYFRACPSYQDFLNRWLMLTSKLLNQGFLVLNLFESFTVTIFTWLTVTEYLYLRWPRICSVVVNTILSSSMAYLMNNRRGVCLFVRFLLTIALSVIRITSSDDPFGIFKLFFLMESFYCVTTNHLCY